ncbi:nucleotide-diphospho-sugar transferase [Nitzschia inconspicua]|uniref:Nucleotide-diphospho-sugar transferase n=1 Tax=Nitzschia inconspicua TaxID=303405 RepID=A0A9K3KCB2_9STRA|nr:nucleotide-diphospho-sugar transferase [Nitzschia inconspicua]
MRNRFADTASDDSCCFWWTKLLRSRLLIALILPVVVAWNISLSRHLTIWTQYFPTDAIFQSTERNATVSSVVVDTNLSYHIPINNHNNIGDVDEQKTITIPNTPTERKSNTIIIGFSDDGYKEIAWRWYQELSTLGYTEHMVVAQDRSTVEYFQAKGMRHDFIHAFDLENESLPLTNVSNFRKERCFDYDKKYGNTPARQHQLYKRSLFGSRWTYVWRQLQAGKNVLLTDVDNVFVRYKDLSELEQEPYDSIHAFAGFLDAFPRNIFSQTGFTICGGMSWLRATPGVLQIVQSLIERCGCQSTLHCHCKCDDQVVLNNIMLLEEPFKIAWDENVTVASSLQDVRWEELTGTCTKTGHRVKVWNRHVAFRRQLDPEVCPDPKLSWIAMPSGVDRTKVYDEWKAACPGTIE